jgi:uncharacterized SAM-binding protein YcdF (DUF218 family)
VFFVLSKIVWFLLAPSTALALAAALGTALVASGRRILRRVGIALARASVVLLLVLGVTPLANLLLSPLENRFPEHDGTAPDGIVVLGGAISTAVSGQRETVALNEASERLFTMIALAVRYPQAKIVFSGGSSALLGDLTTEAAVARRLFAAAGLDQDRVRLEDRSRNTAENAAFSKAVANPGPGERWLLVTSAYHMPRAIGAFRAAGFPVAAYPVDYRIGGAQAAELFPSVADGLKRADTALKEWVGLAAYRLARRTDALFPAP